MNKQKNIAALTAVVLFLLFFLLSTLTLKKIKNIIPSVIVADGIVNINTEEIEYPYAVYEKNDTYINANQQNKIKINLVQTSADYDNCVDISFLKGSFFEKQDIAENCKYAIISDTLANKIFGTCNVLGIKILINETEYKIIGVYKNKTDIISEICFDNTETIFVPIAFGTKTSVLNIIIANKNNMLYDQSFLCSIFKTEQISNYVNYTETLQLADAIFYTFFAFCGLLLIFYILKIGVYAARQMYLELPCKTKKKSIKITVTTIICFAAAIALFSAILKNINIPAKYIAKDNIFNILFYRQAVIQFNQRLITNANIYDFAVKTLFPILFVFVLAAIFMFYINIIALWHRFSVFKHIQAFLKKE